MDAGAPLRVRGFLCYCTKVPYPTSIVPPVAKDKYKPGKSQVPPTKYQRQAVKERTKEHDVAEAAHLDPKYWRSTSEDEEKRA